MKSCLDTESDLSPGTVIKELELEMLDEFGNHIVEDEEVSVQVDGVCYMDNMGSSRKVNDKGYINLNGLLKVTSGYGSKVRIYVNMGHKLIFEKALSVVKRELRMISEVPRYCPAGSNLESVEFGIFDPDGAIDTTIHGHHHALTISSSTYIDNTIQYTFKNGRCIVPYIPIPDNEETVSFFVSHTQYPELCANIQVNVMHAPKLNLPIAELQTSSFQSSCFDDGMLPSPYSLQSSPHPSPSQMNSFVETIVMDELKKREAGVHEAELQVHENEEEISKLANKMTQVESEISSMQAQLKPLYLLDSESPNCSKSHIMKQIESKKGTAASVLCNLSKAIQISEPKNVFLQDVLGLVALLGTVDEPKYSSILAEYLGEDYMLAVVCKSFETASALENYNNEGEVVRDSALHEAAASLGSSINSRFVIICLENIRAYKGALIRNEPKMKLALPKPLLPNGSTPNGFMGYAVNLINIDKDQLDTKTRAGYGLRQTLFYRLFGETQVYLTREQMRQAMPCIRHGAISLDGGIMKENGVVLFGDCDPAVKFPVDFPQTHLQIMDQIEEKKIILDQILDEIEKEKEAHIKAVAKFEKRKEKLKQYKEAKSPIVGSLLSNHSPLSTSFSRPVLRRKNMNIWLE